MKWWVTALIVTVVWIALCIGGAYVLFPNTTPEQDVKISEAVGEICGFGFVVIWVVASLIAIVMKANEPKA